MTKPTTLSQNGEAEELPPEIVGARSLIFNWTSDNDVEQRLRTLVMCLRGGTDALPKSYWTDIIQDIYAARDRLLAQQVQSLYQPEMTDLELNEHQGKERPVVYLDSVLALLTNTTTTGGKS